MPGIVWINLINLHKLDITLSMFKTLNIYDYYGFKHIYRFI